MDKSKEYDNWLERETEFWFGSSEQLKVLQEIFKDELDRILRERNGHE